MNRNQKIIVSITGIVLVTLILIGLTYAYFLTKITGNTNEKSISVTTANLELVYEDDTNEILTKENIQPGEEIGTKSFTVTNKGNTTISDYVVFLEDTNQILETKMSRPQDVKYTLTCTSSLGTACNGVTDGEFPAVDKILVHNIIKSKEVQTYVMTINYIDTGEDQSIDMNKLITGKLNIYDYATINPYSKSTNTLAYNIINNALNNSGDTSYRINPLTLPSLPTETFYGNEVIEEKNEVMKTLGISSDDIVYYADDYEVDEIYGFKLTNIHSCKYSECYANLNGKYIQEYQDKKARFDAFRIYGGEAIYRIDKVGTSSTSKDVETKRLLLKTKKVKETDLVRSEDEFGYTYYYRGNVSNNYLNFNNMCWRIMRINGDGSIKLILEDKEHTCNNANYTQNNWEYRGNIPDDQIYITLGFKELSNGSYYHDYLNNAINEDPDVNELGMAEVFMDFQNYEIDENVSKLKSGDWCLDENLYSDILMKSKAEFSQTLESNNYFYYASEARVRTGTINLKCTGTKFSNFADNTPMYVSTINLDEAIMAGISGNYRSSNTFIKYAAGAWGTGLLSLSTCFDGYDSVNAISILDNGAYQNWMAVDNDIAPRPSINLKANIEFNSGDGTIGNPYTIK